MKIKTYLIILLFFSLGIGGTFMHLHAERNFLATLWAMPFIIITLAKLFPNWKPGQYALENEFGPVRENEASERKYHLKMAFIWGLGALTLPFCLALAALFKKHEGFVVVMVLTGFIFGIACFFKLLGSLLNAFKSQS